MFCSTTVKPKENILFSLNLRHRSFQGSWSQWKYTLWYLVPCLGGNQPLVQSANSHQFPQLSCSATEILHQVQPHNIQEFRMNLIQTQDPATQLFRYLRDFSHTDGCKFLCFFYRRHVSGIQVILKVFLLPSYYIPSWQQYSNPSIYM